MADKTGEPVGWIAGEGLAFCTSQACPPVTIPEKHAKAYNLLVKCSSNGRLTER